MEIEITKADVKKFMDMFGKIIEKLGEISNNIERITIDKIIEEIFLRIKDNNSIVWECFEKDEKK